MSGQFERLVPVVAAIGLILCAIGWVIYPVAMARAWLAVALFIIGLPLGALMVLMIDNLTGGRWGEAIRPLLLAMAGTLPLALLAFVPLLFDLGGVFSWAGDPQHLSLTAQRKLGYLNPEWQVLRFLIVAALWLGLAFVLGVWGGDAPRLLRNRQVASGLGLALHAALFTLFATDWMQALEPDFYSTIYPMLVGTEEAVTAFAAAMLLMRLAGRLAGQAGGEPRATLGEDLGKLLVAAVLFWAYLAFMQWIVIWSGNLPDEIGWYLVRLNNGWQAVLWAIVGLAFAVPFVGLTSRRGKRDPKWLAIIVAATLVGQALEAIWRIVPAYSDTPAILLAMLPAALGLGALWLGTTVWLMRRAERPASLAGGVHGPAR